MNKAMASNQQGSLVGGRFLLEQSTGRTPAGSFWLARDRQTQRACAVRFGDLSTVNARDVATAFASEAEASAQIRCEHALQILAHGDSEGVPFIAQELLIGEALENRIRNTGALPPPKALHYIAEIASALGHAHAAGIVHGRLNAARIYLARASGKEVVKVLDFGAQGAFSDGLWTNRGSVRPLPYTSPEQISGAKATPLSDAWALGALAVYALTGKLPFPATKPDELAREILGAKLPRISQLNPALPRAVDAWADRAMSRAALQRWKGPMELVSGLASALGLPAPRVGASTPPSQPPPSHNVARLGPGEHPATGGGTPGGSGSQPLHSPVPSHPSQLRMTSRGPRAEQTPAPRSAPPGGVLKQTMLGMGTPPPASTPRSSRRDSPVDRSAGSFTPISEVPASGQTVRGLGAVRTPDAITSQKKASAAPRLRTIVGTGSPAPPATSDARNRAPLNRTVLGMGDQRPPLAQSDAKQGAPLNRTVLGMGDLRPPLAQSDAEQGAPLNRTVLGMGNRQPRPVQPQREGRPEEGAELGRVQAQYFEQVLPDAPAQTTPAASLSGSQFLVPRQSTLLGVGDQFRTEVEAVWGQAKHLATRDSEPLGTTRAQFPTDGPSDRAEQEANAAAPPITALQPAQAGLKLRGQGGNVNHSAPSTEPGNGTEPPSPTGIPVDERQTSDPGRASSQPTPSAREVRPKSASDSTDRHSDASEELEPLSSALPNVDRRRKILIAVVASVVLSMLVLLAAALVVQRERPQKAQPAQSPATLRTTGKSTAAPAPMQPGASEATSEPLGNAQPEAARSPEVRPERERSSPETLAAANITEGQTTAEESDAQRVGLEESSANDAAEGRRTEPNGLSDSELPTHTHGSRAPTNSHGKAHGEQQRDYGI